MKHKTEDYKISAVKYYLKHDKNLEEVCDIFECKKPTLARWVTRHENEQSVKRHNRPATSYKITKPQVKYALQLLKQNEQISMCFLK